MNIEKTISNIRGDKAIWVIVFFLSIFSLLAVYSATGSMAYKAQGKIAEFYLLKQLLFLGMGFALMYVAYKLEYFHYYKLAPILLVITVPLLIYTLLFGTEVNEARRWITIPWIDQTIQTSDFARLALMLYLARTISKKQDVIKDFRSAFLPLLLPVIIIVGLIAPADLSTALLLFATSFLLLFIGRVDLKYIFLLVFLGISVLAMIVLIGKFFPDFVRVTTWDSRIQEFFYNTDGGFQIQQAKIAIANGEIFGVGPGNSLQRNYLPYPYADFIYAIIVEEYGLIGGVLIIGLYLMLLFRSISIVTKSPKTFGAILAMGLTLNIVVQAFANIAVAVHLLPVTGLTLPLISMGGSSILTMTVSLGVILSVSKYAEQAQKEKIALQEIEELNESNN
ncbi:MAG: FtsW/RodA/SpoVE family cell cycle protein [Saprospiraceae bacterium]|nr:FtsW/RodA/SpoVE family cell cycle protein [Saprospiraceae bacterium]